MVLIAINYCSKFKQTRLEYFWLLILFETFCQDYFYRLQAMKYIMWLITFRNLNCNKQFQQYSNKTINIFGISINEHRAISTSIEYFKHISLQFVMFNYLATFLRLFHTLISIFYEGSFDILCIFGFRSSLNLVYL